MSARGYGKYEHSVVVRDAPVSELAQDLAVCTFGSDSSWILGTEAPATLPDVIGKWMRRAVSVRQDPAWPGRCVPFAENLVTKLQRRSTDAAVLASARGVLQSLREVSLDPFERVAQADSDQLPRQLADLFEKVRSLSLGTREGWRQVPLHYQRYGTLAMAPLPPLRSLSPTLLRPTLASGSSFVATSSTDGMLHLYDLSNGAMRNTVTGTGVTVGQARDRALRVETDQGARWLFMGSTPRSLAIPADFSIEGDPALFSWDAAITPESFALLTLDHGSLRVRTTAHDGPTAWGIPAAIGTDETFSAAVIAPTSDGWIVTALRPTVSVGVLEQYTVRAATPVAEAPARRHGSHEAPVALAAPELPPSLVVSGPTRVAPDVALFGARVLTCASGTARYFGLVTEQGLTVMRVEGSSVRTSRVSTLWPRGRDATLRCNAENALVSTAPPLARSGCFAFPFDRHAASVGVAVEPPVVGPSAVIRAVVLVRDGLLAIESNGGALRAFRQATRPGARAVGRWEPAGILALATPSPLWTRSFTRVEAVANGDDVTMIVEGALAQHVPRPPDGQDPPAQPPSEPAPAPYLTVMGTSDGGATFWSL